MGKYERRFQLLVQEYGNEWSNNFPKIVVQHTVHNKAVIYIIISSEKFSLLYFGNSFVYSTKLNKVCDLEQNKVPIKLRIKNCPIHCYIQFYWHKILLN